MGRRASAITPRVVVVVATVALFGCSNLELDGRTFDVATCASGQAWGFVGVDLVDGEGRRVFVARIPGDKARVNVFEAPTKSAELGVCGTIEVDVEDDPGEPHLVSGSLRVECAAAGHTFAGRYGFSRCR